MKKITLLTAFFAAIAGFSQANKQKIQTYLDANRGKLQLTSQDISDWVIESEVPGSGTGITSTYIVQRHQGIEVFNAQNNVWIKAGQVLNMPDNNFKSNIASKVNTTTPNLTVLQAIASAYSKVGVTKSANFSITETLSNKSFRLNDGLSDETISAKLVYQPTKENSLKLAWTFQFYSPVNGDLLDLRIDALNGNILEKNNLTISCNFGNHDHLAPHKSVFSFEKSVFKNTINSLTAAPPGIPGQYRVIPYNYTSPNHSPFQLITTTGNLLASPNGWHNANSLTGNVAVLSYTITRGNNAWAKEDAVGDNEVTAGVVINGTSSLTFDFPYGTQTALPTTYTGASTTNLFYMNNIMHDVWYQYGFNENSGNFQKDNFGRGTALGVNNSAGGDIVVADSQDGYSQTTPTLNNANFGTPGDGVRPRMQMFMWNAGAPPTEYITINSPASIAGTRVATTNVFNTTDRIPVPEAPNGITADFALVTSTPLDPLQNPNSACGPITNAAAIAGKIALIRRGGCLFRDKVKKAQDAGALAVIVIDTVANNPTRLSMSSDAVVGITIPALFVTKEIGDPLAAAVSEGTVNGKIEVPLGLYLYADGSFDNTIIAHEYGHGISNKLIGGPANSSCMTNDEQMGEGWSDWFGLMMQLKAGDVGTTPLGVGTYVENQPNTGSGIRTFRPFPYTPENVDQIVAYPYTTDMTLNPSTLARTNVGADVPGGGIYVVGTTWAVTMWDLTWAYIAKYGYDADIYNGTGGNNKVMRLALDALKLQTCNTASFISARNNLIAADQATTGGADYCLITDVFARRGMGLNASSGLPTSRLDQVEDFTPFPAGPNCTLAINYFENNDYLRISPNPSNGMYSIKITNYTGKISLEVVDLNGRLILSNNNIDFDNEKTIDLSQYQSGVYLLKVVGEKLNYTQKLIKN